MRATGIVRRIDELGRVVIPKEIRRTLRIREGDPLEIYTDRDGEVILKKYSPIGEMSSFAKDYTESLFRSLGHIACIVDRDQVVAASGVSKKELWDKPISPDLESAIQARQTVSSNRTGGGRIVPVTNEEDVSGYTARCCLCPGSRAPGWAIRKSRWRKRRLASWAARWSNKRKTARRGLRTFRAVLMLSLAVSEAVMKYIT